MNRKKISEILKFLKFLKYGVKRKQNLGITYITSFRKYFVFKAFWSNFISSHFFSTFHE